jgi:hypothetical protein
MSKPHWSPRGHRNYAQASQIPQGAPKLWPDLIDPQEGTKIMPKPHWSPRGHPNYDQTSLIPKRAPKICASLTDLPEGTENMPKPHWSPEGTETMPKPHWSPRGHRNYAQASLISWSVMVKFYKGLISLIAQRKDNARLAVSNFSAEKYHSVLISFWTALQVKTRVALSWRIIYGIRFAFGGTWCFRSRFIGL